MHNYIHRYLPINRILNRSLIAKFPRVKIGQNNMSIIDISTGNVNMEVLSKKALVLAHEEVN